MGTSFGLNETLKSDGPLNATKYPTHPNSHTASPRNDRNFINKSILFFFFKKILNFNNY